MARGVFTPGNDVSASELNDAFDPPKCRITHSAAQSIVSGTVTAVAFDTDVENVGPCHSTTVNNTRMTVPAGGEGWWSLGANIEFAANATGRREVSLRVNGTTYIATARVPPTAADTCRLHVSTDYRLAAGDYVEVMAFQTSGAGLNVNATNEFTPIATARWTSV